MELETIRRRKRVRRLQSVVVAAGLTWSANPAEAQVKTGTSAVETIFVYGEQTSTDEFRTASRTDIPYGELPSTVDRIDIDSAQLMGAFDLRSALFQAPGLSPTWRYGGFLQVRSRGFRAIILHDGRRDDRSTIVNSHPQGGLWDLERIEVLKGPAATLYGFGSIGGVVNLVRKQPLPVTQYEASVAGGAPGQIQAHLGGTGRVFDLPRLFYRADVGYTFHRDIRDHETHRGQASLALAYQPHPDHRVLLRSAFYRDRYNTDSGIPTVEGDDGRFELPPGADLSNRYNSDQDRLDYIRWEIELDYQWQIVDGLRLRNRASFAIDEYEYGSTEGLSYSDEPSPQVTRDFFFYFYHHWYPIANQLELHWDFKSGPFLHRFMAGYDITAMANNHSDRDSTIFDASLPPADYANPVTDITEIDIRRDNAFISSLFSHAPFVQYHLSTPGDFFLLLGGRFDHVHFSSRREFYDRDTGRVTDRGDTDDREESAFTYKVGIVNTSIPMTDLYVSWATAFRPNVRLGQSRDSEGDFQRIEPERGRQLEGGLRFNLDPLNSLSLTGYWIEKDNVTFSRAQDILDTAGAVRSRGLETTLSILQDIGLWQLGVDTNYAYTDATFETFFDSNNRDLAGNRPTFVADHTAMVWLSGSFDRTVGLGLGARYFGSQFANNTNTIELEPYVVLSAAGWYRPTQALEFAVTGTNLTNERDYFVSSIDGNLTPGQGIEVLGRVNLRR